MTHTRLSKQLDKISYDTLSETRPAAIARINEYLDKGGTAKHFEATIQARHGRKSLMVSLFVGAAYYLESERKRVA